MAKDRSADLDRIKELIDIMKQNDLTQIEISSGDEKISLKRTPPAAAQPAAAPPREPAAAPAKPGAAATDIPAGGEPAGELADIKSPIVGIFYSAASPESEPYIEAGSHVDPQTVVCIVEAMKVMNEIKPDVSGTVVKVCVKNGQAVEYGQVLFQVRPD